MPLFALGLNHRTAPLDVRERVAFDPARLATALREMVGRRDIREAAILSTCNRTEIYCSADAPQPAVDWLAEYHAVPAGQLQSHLYQHPQRDAVRHMFRVASGLDSMVLGEPQILGQMKQAARVAEDAGTLGTTLGKLFQRTFAVAKEVRSTTAIGANVVSMAAAAVHLAGRVFGDLATQRVLFVGAGEMVELCLNHFAAQRPKSIAIANRTPERAAALAAKVDATVIPLDSLSGHLQDYDVIVACTASPLPIIGLGLVERALKQRRRKPMVMVDLALPRDIESEVAELDDVFLYTIDDLAQIVESGLEARQAAVVDAESIIDTQVSHFLHWLDARGSVPVIRALRDSGERMRRHEVDHALRALARGDAPEQVIDRLSQALANKLLHGPTHALNQAEGAERDEVARLISRLYNLHTDS